MIRFALLLSILRLIAGHQQFEPCGLPGGCYCSFPILTDIHCTDNITVFPLFDDDIKAGVLSITFYKSRIVNLPPFHAEPWKRLKVLSFIDTPHLTCEVLPRLHRPGLDISLRWISDKPSCPYCERIGCPTDSPKHCPKQRSCVGYLATTLVLIIGIGVSGTVMTVVLKRRGFWDMP